MFRKHRNALRVGVTLTLVGLTISTAWLAITPRRSPGSIKSRDPWSGLQFGYVKAFTRTGAGYTLRLALALRLSGTTGRLAAIADGASVPPHAGLYDDFYIKDLDYTLTHQVAPKTPIEVLVNLPPNGQASTIGQRQITAAELYESSRPKAPNTLKLMDRRLTGFGFNVETTAPDIVVRMTQVYSP